jgi:hypothetical protein
LRVGARVSGFLKPSGGSIGSVSGGANATSFDVIGEDIQKQYLIESTVGYETESGFKAGLSTFGEFGDIQGYGGRMSIAKAF